jgi:hypothetical protein
MLPMLPMLPPGSANLIVIAVCTTADAAELFLVRGIMDRVPWLLAGRRRPDLLAGFVFSAVAFASCQVLGFPASPASDALARSEGCCLLAGSEAVRMDILICLPAFERGAG